LRNGGFKKKGPGFGRRGTLAETGGKKGGGKLHRETCSRRVNYCHNKETSKLQHTPAKWGHKPSGDHIQTRWNYRAKEQGKNRPAAGTSVLKQGVREGPIRAKSDQIDTQRKLLMWWRAKRGETRITIRPRGHRARLEGVPSKRRKKALRRGVMPRRGEVVQHNNPDAGVGEQTRERGLCGTLPIRTGGRKLQKKKRV